MVKMDVGCFIDGYISVAAHTLIVGPCGSPEEPITGRQADVMMAAITACEVAVSLLRPGNTNSQITSAVAKVAHAYSVRTVAGVLSHRLKRFVIDSNKMILLREDVDQKVENQTFELNEAYALDIIMSSGEGKPREAQTRTTVFKRAVAARVNLTSGSPVSLKTCHCSLSSDDKLRSRKVTG